MVENRVDACWKIAYILGESNHSMDFAWKHPRQGTGLGTGAFLALSGDEIPITERMRKHMSMLTEQKERRLKARFRRFRAAAAAGIMLWGLLAPAMAQAASIVVVTPAIRSAFDETAASAAKDQAARLKTLFGELAVLEAEYESREKTIRDWSTRNAKALAEVNTLIKEIDTAEVARLESRTKALKAKCKPLFDQYTELNKRIATAKKLKSKTVLAVLQVQGDGMKTMVQLARAEIRREEDALKAAKDARSRKVKAARAKLAAIDGHKADLKAAKSSASASGKRLSADWSSFKSAVRKQNPELTRQSLAAVTGGLRQTAVYKQKIIVLEQRISAVIAGTKSSIL